MLQNGKRTTILAGAAMLITHQSRFRLLSALTVATLLAVVLVGCSSEPNPAPAATTQPLAGKIVVATHTHTPTPVPSPASLHNPKWESLSYYLELDQKHKMDDPHLDYICVKKIHSEYVGQTGCFGEGMVPSWLEFILEEGDEDYSFTFVISTFDTRNKHSVRTMEYSIKWLAETPYSEYGTLDECIRTSDPEFSFDCDDQLITDRAHALIVVWSRFTRTGFDQLLEKLVKE